MTSFRQERFLDPIEDIPRGQRAIHRKLNLFLNTVMDHPQLTSSLIPFRRWRYPYYERSRSCGRGYN